MKKLTIVWGILVILLALSLLFIGINSSKKYKDYRAMESDIVEAIRVYSGQEENLKSLPVEGETLRVSLNELIEKKLIINNKVLDDKCDGYGTIKGKSISFEYKAYIKCKNYTTKGYKTTKS